MAGEPDEMDDSAPPPTSGLVVQPDLIIPRGELLIRVSRAGGAGGQHVNKTSSRVETVWNVARSAVLTPEQRARLMERLATRLDADGNVRVVASETRSQLRNREAAEARLAELVRRGLVVPKKRKRTKPSRAAIERRLEEKKRTSKKKSDRNWRED